MWVHGITSACACLTLNNSCWAFVLEDNLFNLCVSKDIIKCYSTKVQNNWKLHSLCMDMCPVLCQQLLISSLVLGVLGVTPLSSLFIDLRHFPCHDMSIVMTGWVVETRSYHYLLKQLTQLTCSIKGIHGAVKLVQENFLLCCVPFEAPHSPKTHSKALA